MEAAIARGARNEDGHKPTGRNMRLMKRGDLALPFIGVVAASAFGLGFLAARFGSGEAPLSSGAFPAGLILLAAGAVVAVATVSGFLLSGRVRSWLRDRNRSARLLQLSQELSSANDLAEIWDALKRHLSAAGFEPVGLAIVRMGDNGPLWFGNVELQADEIAAVADGMAERDFGLPVEFFGLKSANQWLGRLAIALPHPLERAQEGEQPAFAAEQQAHIETVSTFVAAAILRAMHSEEAARLEANRQSERLRNLLLSSLSHDLRTPLTVLSGTIGNLARMRKRLPREAMDEVLSLARQIAYLQRFTANLLSIAAISAGQLKLNRQIYLLQEIVGVALTRVQETKGQRRIRTVIAGDIPMVEIDGALIEQVITNLLENSIRHTDENGEISITLERAGEQVHISVADNGTGLGAGNEEIVFERFNRGSVQTSDRKAAGGTGLGLAICRGIVEAHGGIIDARNNPSGGATFHFTLPVSKEQ